MALDGEADIRKLEEEAARSAKSSQNG